MSMLNFHRSSFNREQERAVKAQKEIASISGKLSQKQRELARSNQTTQQQRLTRDIQTLLDQRAKADKDLADSQKKISDLSIKIQRDEESERKKADEQEKRRDRQRQQSQRTMERTLATTTAAVGDLHDRVSTIEDRFMARVREAVIADPVPRQHDVFLCHAGPDMEIAKELYAELTARGLDVWIDDQEVRLGDPLTRQIDRGIASSHVGVILVTEAFLKGRFWTDIEMGAFFSSRRRVIPVLVDVTREAVEQYSPLLADRVGLSNEYEGFDTIAERIVDSLEHTDVTP